MGETRILVADIGGNNLKLMVSGAAARHKVPSGPEFTPAAMIAAVEQLYPDRGFERASVGYPAPVHDNRPLLEPHNMGAGWARFDFAAALAVPTKVVNDAVMQALGSYDGGTMLFLGFGTGLGAALVVQGHSVPLELAHMPYREGRTFEDDVGRRGLKRLGRKLWQEAVFDVTERLRRATVADYVVLGGGNAKKLRALPPHCRLGDNSNAFVGGLRLWGEVAGYSGTTT